MLPQRLFPALLVALLAGWAGIASAFTMSEIQVRENGKKGFRAGIAVQLGHEEKIVGVSVGSPADYSLLGLFRPQFVETLVPTILFSSQETRLQLESDLPMPGEVLDLLLRVSSNHHTHFPVFRINLKQPAIQSPSPEIAKEKPPREIKTASPLKNPTPAPKKRPATAKKAQPHTPERPLAPADPPPATPATGPDPPANPPITRKRSYGPVREGEHLTSISIKIRRRIGYSVYQVMWAVFKINRSHFNRDNMNGLQAGAILNLPSSGEISRVNNRQAQTALKLHNRIWQGLPVLQAVPENLISHPVGPPEIPPQPVKKPSVTIATEDLHPPPPGPPPEEITDQEHEEEEAVATQKPVLRPLPEKEAPEPVPLARDKPPIPTREPPPIWKPIPETVPADIVPPAAPPPVTKLAPEPTVAPIPVEPTTKTVSKPATPALPEPQAEPAPAPTAPVSSTLETDQAPRSADQTELPVGEKSSRLEAILEQLQLLTRILEGHQKQRERLDQRITAMEQARKEWDAIEGRLVTLEQNEKQRPSIPVATAPAPGQHQQDTKQLLWLGIFYALSGTLMAAGVTWFGRRWNRADHWDNLQHLLKVTAEQNPEKLKEALEKTEPDSQGPFVPSTRGRRLNVVTPPVVKKTVADNLEATVAMAAKLKSMNNKNG